MSVIEVRLKDPPGMMFATDDWTLGEGGYVLHRPAVQARGAAALRAMADEPIVRVPSENVQYAIEYQG
jgi:hypothetical protein